MNLTFNSISNLFKHLNPGFRRFLYYGLLGCFPFLPFTSSQALQFDTFGDGFWSIVNKYDARELVVGTTGAKLATEASAENEKQFQVLLNLENNTYRIRQRSSWLCIGSQSTVVTQGSTIVLQSSYTGTPLQQWRIIDIGSGYYRILLATNSFALQTDGTTNGKVFLAIPTSDPRQQWKFVYKTHYPKKGLAGWESNLYRFRVSWFYNWDRNPSISPPASIAFAPMQWGQWWPDLNTLQQSYAAWHKSAKPVFLLGFNEPDHSDQANMDVNTAISIWPKLQAMDVPLVSPACANSFGGWLAEFYNQIDKLGYRVDYTAVHWYANPDANGLINYLQNIYNSWKRPIWLTEFSTVDWSGNATWTEEDNYRFLAEFLWRAEDLTWLKRYSIFPFSGKPSTNPWDRIGQRGNVFKEDNYTFTPFGELYASWDGDRSLQERTPYFIQNKATSHRLGSVTNSSLPVALSIRSNSAISQWAFKPATTKGRWFIVSMNDGRRLIYSNNSLRLAPPGTIGTPLEWSFNGPDANGYYFIEHPASGRTLRMDRQNNSEGAPIRISFSMEPSGNPSDNTRWRFIKPYNPSRLGLYTGPVLSIPNYDGINLSFSVEASPYLVYYLDYKPSLSSTSWTTVASGYVNTITNLTLIHQPIGNNTGFYRIRVDW